jgi:ABC-2 type transport system ATP-binding protein
MTAAGTDDRTLEVRGLTKRFGQVAAVSDLSFTVPPGRVTGFLGPNGAGKTTTLRMLLGLVAPTAGTATVGGRRYAELDRPLHSVGAVLEASSFHPGRSGRNHLRVLAATAGLPASRADEVLGTVGLADAGGRRVGGYSLGMRQRLGLASALLGDPGVLILDEPANGLDPEGIAWLRGFLRHLAAEGRTVLVSSHVLSEVQQTVDDVVIIARGRLVTTGPLASLSSGEPAVRVVTPTPEKLAEALRAAGLPGAVPGAAGAQDGTLTVTGAAPRQVGAAAFAAGVELHELTAVAQDLESTFLRLTETGPSAALPPPPTPSQPAPYENARGASL